MKFEMQPVLVRGLFYRDLIAFFFFALAFCKSPDIVGKVVICHRGEYMKYMK